MTESKRLPPGHQWYDPFNGIRIGGLAGAILGGIATAFAGVGFIWLIAVGAVLGGGIGYWYAKRTTQRAASE
jgi:outer membrane lipoprotein SlyB